ncbi:MAG: hypothetical protein IPO43_10140 [Rhodoferax sp.]|nr:hypothetical protein [Rhodoferax sp.]
MALLHIIIDPYAAPGLQGADDMKVRAEHEQLVVVHLERTAQLCRRRAGSAPQGAELG